MVDYSVLKHRHGRQLNICERTFNHCKKLFRKKLPLFYRIITSSPNEFKIAKSIICFLIGTIYGALIYTLTIANIDEINMVYKLLLGTFIIAIISIGMAFELQMRCIVSLSVVNFVSGSGRIIIISYIIAHITLIEGPIAVGYRNYQELSMSILCYKTFIVDKYKDSFNIKWKPYKDIIVGLVTGNKDLLESGKRVNNLVQTLDNDFGSIEIDDLFNSGNQAVKKSESVDYDFSSGVAAINKAAHSDDGKGVKLPKFDDLFKKVKTVQCESLIETGIRLCNSGYNKIIAACKEKLGLIGFFCNLINLLNFCSVSARMKLKQGTDKKEFCEKQSNEGSADGLQNDVSALHQLTKVFGKNVSISMTYLKSKKDGLKNYTVDSNHRSQFSNVLIEAKSMQEDLSIGIYYIKLICSIAKIISSYGFCMVFWQSFQYNKSYLNDVGFDNCYITQYFRHIDARRYKLQKQTVLPIKKLEEVYLIYPTETRILERHKKHIKFGMFLCSVLISFTLFVIVANFFIADFNGIIQKHGQIVHIQSGRHKIIFDVQGKGFIAKMTRRILKSIHIDNNIYKETDTSKCLPKPHYLSNSALIRFTLLFILLYAAVFFEIYIQRFNRYICAFFYRRWEKQRILFLYNKTLKNRKIYMRNLIKRAIMRSKGFEIEPDTSLVAILVDYINKSKRFKCLSHLFKVLKIGLAKCLLCDQTERIGSIKCDICESMYCYECWLDAQNTCLVCTPSIYEQPDWKFEGSLKFQ